MADAPSGLSAALVDRYTVERELGSGGMATVYLAQDLKHDRQVALKLAALARAMARDPADRFADVTAFARALATAPARTVVAPEPSIALLPFTNMSDSPEAEYFSDGVSDEITNVLSRMGGLRVAARTSAFAFKGAREDLRAVGEKLNVATVLEGSVRRAGNRVRVTVRWWTSPTATTSGPSASTAS